MGDLNTIIGRRKTTVCDVWFRQLESCLRENLQNDAFWIKLISELTAGLPRVGLHLGVFVEPYLKHILEGRKTVESRFSVNKCAPYQRVRQRDILLLKRTGGPICGVCRIGQVWTYRLDSDSLDSIKEEFSTALCVADSSFWKQREKASFATLMQVTDVRAIPSVQISKRDRRGWVTIRDASAEEQDFEFCWTDRKREVNDCEARR